MISGDLTFFLCVEVRTTSLDDCKGQAGSSAGIPSSFVRLRMRSE